MVVPIAMAELDEADAALGEAAGEEAVVGEGGFAGRGAVEVEHVLRLLGEVGELGDAGLHAEGELVVFDLRGDGRVAEPAEGDAVEVVHGVDQLAAASRR